MKKELPTVTLIGADCVDLDRLVLAADVCQKQFQFGDVKLLTSLPSGGHDNIIPIEHIGSTEAYSEFVISKLDEYVDTPHALVVQYDGFILNPNAWTDEFLKYDYIGAPWLVADWSVTNFGFPENTIGSHLVGNGGFSLRSKRLLSLLAGWSSEGRLSTYHPEDVVICVEHRKALEEEGMRFASVELAQQFSFEAENRQNNVWDEQFGFHGLRWTDISRWLDENPEYKSRIDNTLDKDG